MIRFLTFLTAFYVALSIPAIANMPKREFKQIKQIVYDIQRINHYQLDIEQYGVKDYGQDVRITGYGDCEDFAIAYRNAILERFPHYKEHLKILLVQHWDWQKQQDMPHAILIINRKGRSYVADTVGTSPGGDKVIISVKDLRATQYSPKRIKGEIVYHSPERLTLINQHNQYEKGF